MNKYTKASNNFSYGTVVWLVGVFFVAVFAHGWWAALFTLVAGVFFAQRGWIAAHYQLTSDIASSGKAKVECISGEYTIAVKVDDLK